MGRFLDKLLRPKMLVRANDKKFLDYEGLAYLLDKLSVNSGPTEVHYNATIPKGVYIYAIPNYEDGKSTIEAYLNGLRLIQDKDYRLSTSGQFNLISGPHTDDNVIYIVHRKWG